MNTKKGITTNHLNKETIEYSPNRINTFKSPSNFNVNLT